MLLKRVRAGTECVIGGRVMWVSKGIVEGVWIKCSAIRQVCEKYLANWKDVFKAFMYLENSYDTIDRHATWWMLRVHGVGGKLLKAV